MRNILLLPVFLFACRAVSAACNRDNCLRALVRSSEVGSAFCASYTSPGYSSTILPEFVSHCLDLPSRISSACSCLFPATTSQSTTASSANTSPSFPTSTSSCYIVSVSTVYVTLPPVTATITLPPVSLTKTDIITQTLPPVTATDTLPPVSLTETDTLTQTLPPVTATKPVPPVSLTETDTATQTLPPVTDILTDVLTATATIEASVTVTAPPNYGYTAFPLYTNSPSCLYFGNGLDGVQYTFSFGPDNESEAVAACEALCFSHECSFITIWYGQSYAPDTYWCYLYPAGDMYQPSELACTSGYNFVQFSEGWSLA